MSPKLSEDQREVEAEGVRALPGKVLFLKVKNEQTDFRDKGFPDDGWRVERRAPFSYR